MLENFYKGNYKTYLAIPVILMIASAFLAFIYPGVPRGIDLSGGTLILIRSDKALDAKQAEEILTKNFSLSDLSVVSTSSPLGGNGLTIRFAEDALLANAGSELSLAKSALKTDPATALQHAKNVAEILRPYLQPAELPAEPAEAVDAANTMLIDAKENFSKKIQQLIVERFNLGDNIAFQKKEVSPTLGSAFYSTAINAGILGFILVIIVVFAFFRKVVPSMAVIASAILDILGAMGLMALFRIPLTLSSIPALLMLIGYSIDTDTMLTTKVLTRREESPAARAHDAMMTGLTMTGTTIAAMAVMLVFSIIGQMEVMYEISAVLLSGLLFDITSTWLMNAPVLLWYVEMQGKKRSKK